MLRVISARAVVKLSGSSKSFAGGLFSGRCGVSDEGRRPHQLHPLASADTALFAQAVVI
jgi:hypothetical protein